MPKVNETEEEKIVKNLFQRYLEEQKKKAEITSREYKLFTKKYVPQEVKLYYNLVKKISKFFKVKAPAKQKEKLDDALRKVYLPLTADEVVSFSYFVLIVALIISIGTFFVFPLFGALLVPLSILLFYNLYNYPITLYLVQKARASTELILSILYIVIFMQTTPNFENALKFAADNLRGPLSRDFQKILWDLQAAKYPTLADAINEYVLQWEDKNKAYMDAIHLIEASLSQTDDKRRLAMLEGALNRILSGTIEVMNHYVNELRTPVDALFMLGVTLPVMGLVLFPILGAFMGGVISAGMLFVFYDIAIPAMVMIIGRNILQKRPVAFRQPDVYNHPEAPKKWHFKFMKWQIPSIVPAILVFLAFFLPFLYYFLNFRGGLENPKTADVYMSFLFTLSVGMSIWAFAYFESHQKMKIREKIRDIETHFADAIFQVGNRMAEGFPPETALIKTANSMRGTTFYGFIWRIVHNLNDLGMNLRDAIFNKVSGAVKFFPSPMIESAMKIFVSSAEKSPDVTSKALISISKYLKKVHDIEEKVNDVMSEILSNMRFQSSFIAPMISGIVVGLTTMIIRVLFAIQGKTELLQQGLMQQGQMGLGLFAFGMFQVSNTLPLDVFQIIVGVYMLEVVIISSSLAAQIKYGDDKLQILHNIATLLLPAILVYLAVSLITTFLFSSIADLAIAVGAATG